MSENQFMETKLKNFQSTVPGTFEAPSLHKIGDSLNAGGFKPVPRMIVGAPSLEELNKLSKQLKKLKGDYHIVMFADKKAHARSAHIHLINKKQDDNFGKVTSISISQSPKDLVHKGESKEVLNSDERKALEAGKLYVKIHYEPLKQLWDITHIEKQLITSKNRDMATIYKELLNEWGKSHEIAFELS